MKELRSAWQENEKALQRVIKEKDIAIDSPNLKKEEEIKKKAKSYISKKHAYNALKFLTMKGNKRSYWNKDFCNKIKIPKELISEEINNKK